MIIHGELKNVTDIHSLEETDTVVLLLITRELLKYLKITSSLEFTSKHILLIVGIMNH